MFQLFKKLGIAEHEKPSVKFLWQLRFLFQLGFIFSWTIITAIFIEIFGVQNLLYLLFADAVILLFGSAVANFLFLRTELNHFLLGTIGGTILFALLAFVFRENIWFYFLSAIIAKDLFFAQLNIAILRKNESLFSPKAAQKIMPIIESGITIGTVIAASVFLGLLEIFPTKDLLAFWLIPLGIMAFLIWRSPKALAEIPDLCQEEESASHGVREGILAVKKIPFLAFLTTVVFFQSALFAVADFEFLKSVESHTTHKEQHFDASDLQTNLFHDSVEKVITVGHKIAESAEQTVSKIFVHETLAHDLGLLSLIFGLISLVVQLFLASRILEKVGIINSMLLYFGGFLGLAATFLGGGTNMNFVRGFQHGGHSLFESAYHLTFYSVFSHSREILRHFLEGFVKPLGVIFGVLLVIFFQLFWFQQATALLMVGLAFLLGILTFGMRRKFTNLSTQNLQSDQNISAKLDAVEVLAQKGHGKESVLVLAKELLNKKNHAVIREKITVMISKINDPQIIHTYLEILADESESNEIKIQSLDSLLKMDSLRNYWKEHVFSQHHLLRLLQKIFKETDDAHLKKLVIMNIFAHLPIHQVVPFFLEMIKQHDEELKSVCLRSSVELFDDPEIVYYLKQFLYEKNPRLRGHAVISLWKFGEKKLLRQVINDLLLKETKEEKIAGIYAIGEVKDQSLEYKLYPYLESELFDLKLHSLVALAKIGNESVFPDILEILFGGDRDAAQKLFYMMKRAGKDVRDKLKKEIQFKVSHKVMDILLAENVREKSHLSRLSDKSKESLKWLYRLAEKYDGILLMESVGV